MIDAGTVLEFEKLIQQTTGIAAETLGTTAVETALKRRLQACQLENPNDYLQRLRVSKEEMQALIDEVVVPETWFFRNREAFEALSREALTKWIQTESPLRLLSLPCSTGEEPYSMSMALLDVGVPAKGFHIDAVDICAQSLELARQAEYGRNSFRGKQLEFRERHFVPKDKTFLVAERIKKQVRFRLGNMLNPTFMPETGMYDFIFCRNVLIYFDRETQENAVKVLTRLLKKDSVLFVGPSESGLLMENGFASAQWSLTFAFVKKMEVAKAEAVKSLLTVKPTMAEKPIMEEKTKPIFKVIKQSPLKALPILAPRVASNPSIQESPTLIASAIAEISELADQGKLKEALHRCEVLMRSDKPSAHLFYLTGLIHDTNKSYALAEQFYRKALYLEPGHIETITHLAFLLEQRGDNAAAQNLRQRAKRMKA